MFVYQTSIFCGIIFDITHLANQKLISYYINLSNPQSGFCASMNCLFPVLVFFNELEFSRRTMEIEIFFSKELACCNA